jgi:hypothetical protein
MRSRRSTEYLALCVAALFLGCSDGLTPNAIAGTYRLERVGNSPLPAIVYSDPLMTTRVFSETLEIGADGFAEITSDLEHRYLWPDAPPPSRGAASSRYIYELVDRMIELRFFCGINALCTDSRFTARRTARGLVIEGNEFYGTRHYVRR